LTGRHALGVHIGHDRVAALVSDGVLVAQIAEERLDRVKHSNAPDLPLRSIRAVLDIGHIRPDDLGVAGISYTNVDIGAVLPLLAEEMQDDLGVPSLEVIGVGHHDAHAWSGWCTTDLTEALIVVADGSGDVVNGRLEAESVYLGAGDSIHLLGRRLQDFGTSRMTRRNSFMLPYMIDADRTKDISLGNKYEQFTYLAGFSQREGGKTMGLAAYADPLFRPEIPAIRDLQFPLQFETGLIEIDRLWRQSGDAWHRFVRQRAAAIAASGQSLLEEYMLALLRTLDPSGAHRNLCAAGGVFLNCQMNGRIVRETRFENLHVVPAAGDDGQCIGSAFFAYAQAFAPPQRGADPLPYLGPHYDRAAITQDIQRAELSAEELEDGQLMERIAQALADGLIVGLFRGRSECGPRALCHRSLLADPRRADMKDRLNGLKGRELFRPFAPAVTEEDQATFFELEPPSPFMLVATALRPRFRDVLPAITHIDGSARVQAVSRAKEPFIHALLRAFAARTGYPVLLNTSFNLAGEPIVESPRDAINTFLASEIDCLVLENQFLHRKATSRSLNAPPTAPRDPPPSLRS
jgi:carbamoyltransferase